jgi:hypothetical protein
MTVTTERPDTRARQFFDRSYPLEGIEIVSRAKGGDGRTVEAYASVFDVPTEIHDEHGHYIETIDRVRSTGRCPTTARSGPWCSTTTA